MINYEFSCLREILSYAEKHKEALGSKLYDMPLNFIHMYYPVKEIADEVEKRTSYLGKSKLTEDGHNLLDMLSMTRDEGDLYESYILDAMASTYDRLSGFGKRLCNSFIIHNHENTHIISENKGKNVSLTSLTTTIDYTTHKINASYTLSIDKALESNDELVYILTINYTYGTEHVGVTKSVKKYKGDSLSGTLSLDIANHNNITIDEKVSEVYIQDKAPTDIKENDWVILEKLDGSKQMYQAMHDANTNSDLNDRGLFEPVSFVVDQNSIHFVIEEQREMNHNGLLGADIALKNAIVTFVEYRWFETVGQSEIAQIAYAEHQRHLGDLQKRLSYTTHPKTLRTRWF